MKKSIILSFLFAVFNSAVLFSQNLSVQGMVSPSLSTIYTDGKSHFNYLFSFNTGLKISYQRNKITYSTGILQLTQGATMEITRTTYDNPEGSLGTATYYLRVKSILIPVQVDYTFYEKNKSSFFYGLGLIPGLVYSQEQENPPITPAPGVISIQPPYEKYWEVRLVPDFYLGINMGLGYKYRINSRYGAIIRPNILFQLRTNKPNALTNRLMNYGIDFGLGYKLNK